MCGINGIINKQNNSLETISKEIHQMNDLIVHRGPDDDGVFYETNDNDSYSIALGMRRLSIIDLHSGQQPIFTDNKQIVIVFNGEIYNYPQLRRELQLQGITFNTQSDTEVILKLYEKEGEDSFKKLDGMFAFSIYDKIKDKVFIVRDFFGEKPLYYTDQHKQFIWGSELKSVIKTLGVKPQICKMGLNLFFKLTYIPSPYTIYEGINKLEPNHYIAYDLVDKVFEIFPVEKEINHPEKSNDSFTEAKSHIRSMMYDSVLSRSISDVPIGTFLSGGVDSSIVSLCLAQAKSIPIDTFSIGFEKKTYDETDKSQLVAKLIGSKHHEFTIGENEIQSHVDEILQNFDEPFADSSALPTYLVSKKTSEHVKVALTGDGGDEVFGGYGKYYMGKVNKRYTAAVPKGLHNFITSISSGVLKDSHDSRGLKFRINRGLTAMDYGGQYYWDILSLGYPSDHINKYFQAQYIEPDVFNWYKKKTNISSPNCLTDYRITDKHVSLEGDMLVKVDRTSMLNSLECRAPFLNKKIWNYVNTLPESYLMKNWDKKYLLKAAFKDQFPEGFLDKGKRGFGVPVGDWLKSSLKNELESYIEHDILERQQIFKVSEICWLVNNHLSGQEDNTFKVWTFYCFQKWYYNTYEKL